MGLTSFKQKSNQNIDEFGRTDLHYAANEGKVESIKKILSSGEDPNLQDKNGWTPLHFAAQLNSVEIIEKLIEAGAEVEIKDEYGNTPLFRAVFCSKGEGSVIKLLIKAGDLILTKKMIVVYLQ